MTTSSTTTPHINTLPRSVSPSSSSPSPEPEPSHSLYHGINPRNPNGNGNGGGLGLGVPGSSNSNVASLSTTESLKKERRRSSHSATNPAGTIGGASGRGIYSGSSGTQRTRASSRGALPRFVDKDNGIDGQIPETPITDGGFSTQYGASASSIAGISESEDGEFLRAGRDTEVDRGHKFDNRRKELEQSENIQRVASPTPPPAARLSFPPRKPTAHVHHPIPSTYSLFPLTVGFPRPLEYDCKGKGRGFHLSFRLTRKRCENAILLGAVVVGIWRLGVQWEEKALAGELSLLVGLSIVYTALRFHPIRPRLTSPFPSSSIARPQSPSLPPSSVGTNHVRERVARGSVTHPASGVSGSYSTGREELRRMLSDEIEQFGIGERGCVWGTEEREYRECLDDGIFYALLLAPLVAAALLHAALSQLAANPLSPIPKGWNIEFPMVLPSTPIKSVPQSPSNRIPTDTIRALSALATSRRNLVQLFTLCSFVLLVHLTRTLHLELKQAKVNKQPTSQHVSAPLERENSEQARTQQPSPASLAGTYWLRRGEWRRTRSVVGFSFLVTGGCIVVKTVTAYIGRGVWSDIVIATLFYQFSLYVCVRLARRGFTLGELAVVCNAATALFMETVNLTRMKIRILRTPYIKTYRLPTPLLTFQLALIPGSLLAGFLLSPLLYLSRNLAQKPAHRLRFPHEKSVHRRLLALGFYAGAALVCGGIVGLWTSWCLDGRNPYTWIVYWLFEGRYAWSRPVLISYWGALAAISVAAWERQLNRARKHRRYIVPGTSASRNESSPSVAGGNGSSSGNGGGTSQERLGGVATQMMDAADQRMPTLSVNARRKSFHALAVIMFVPGIAFDPAFTHLSFSVAFAAFNFAEYIRYFALWPFGVSVHLFLNEFLDHKDSGTAILSHFYLLAGCASPLWLEGPSEILAFFGVLSLGVGDALASIVGRRIGRVRWSIASGKTVEGSVAFFFSMLLCSALLWAFGLVEAFIFTPYTIATVLATLLEAFSAQNDNLILPMYGWAIGTLLGV
ncbi:hypothetical protein CI109_100656 [Kwoniella shandongensis]|uniref:dolichol kinase n=1 Tax=Kwoniella shandongensis TaxID=1734106 RepID=A0AAJ8LF44_9TREE